MGASYAGSIINDCMMKGVDDVKIAVIQASSQKDKNLLLHQAVLKAVADDHHEVINFGVYEEETNVYSYIDIALLVSLLLDSGAIEFVITGCSSGQGMMLACNSLPRVLCGYVANPSDAYLFGRINDGNAVSFPLGLNFGWAGELNLQYTLDQLFSGSFGSGYPKQDAKRKQTDTKMLKQFNAITKRAMTDILPSLDAQLLRHVLHKENVYDYIRKHGTHQELLAMLPAYR